MDVPKDAYFTLDDLEKAMSFTLIGDGFLNNRIMQDNARISFLLLFLNVNFLRQSLHLNL